MTRQGGIAVVILLAVLLAAGRVRCFSAPAPNIIHASAYAPDLGAALAACGGRTCEVWTDPGTSYTVGNTPLQVGSETVPVTLICDGAVITCVGTAGKDCVQEYSKGRIIGL